jgi:Ankyrin repeats (3 copies)/Ankyrin repeats (many copies)
MNPKCLIGRHEWRRCTCAKCGKENHNWAKNCEKCDTCGKARVGAHSWKGCKCSTCVQIRDEGHDRGPDRLKCARCGSVPSIHGAASSGDTDLVRRLLEHDPALLRSEENTMTPLHRAAQKGHIAVAELLLAKGADIHRKSLGKTPLHEAAAGDHIAMADLLIRSGADVNAGHPHAETPLHSAATLAGPEMVNKLLSSGAFIDAQDNLEYTPLHWAVNNRKSSIVRVLCEHGADKSKRTFRGETAEQMARGLGLADLVEALGTQATTTSRRPESWLAGHVVNWFYYSGHAPYEEMIQKPALFFEHICNRLHIDPADLGEIPQGRGQARSRIRHSVEGSLASVAGELFGQHLHKGDNMVAFAYECPCIFRAPGALVVLVRSESIDDVGANGKRIDFT